MKQDSDGFIYLLRFGSLVRIKSNTIGISINSNPVNYLLLQNYPNPFNPVTKINYQLPKTSKVNLLIYDIQGRVVIRLINSGIKESGWHSIEFNAQNYPSGVYFYRIEAGDFVQSKKMVLVK
ncbi:MAG TPA: T9SS type A sorting domain-containing protein [Ignavibacteria bacterium]